MLPNHVLAWFPHLRTDWYRVASPPDGSYNCIAWAANDSSRKWWPHRLGGYFWPDSAPRDESLATFLTIFGDLGYKRCGSGSYEAGYEKIAFYGTQQMVTHAARQVSGGRWVSKLGDFHDIEHERPESVVCHAYGAVFAYAKRPSRRADLPTRIWVYLKEWVVC